MIKLIFNSYYLEDKILLFIISCILLLIMIIIPFIIANKIIKRR